MMTLMLAALGWCLVSVAVAVLFAALMSGARAGELRNRPALGLDAAASRSAAPPVVPAPRAGVAGEVVAA